MSPSVPNPGPGSSGSVQDSLKKADEASTRLEARITRLQGWVYALVGLGILLFVMALIIIVLLRLKP